MTTEAEREGLCYWCRSGAVARVTFEETGDEIDVCGWHSWPYVKGRSRPCNVRDLNPELTNF